MRSDRPAPYVIAAARAVCASRRRLFTAAAALSLVGLVSLAPVRGARAAAAGAPAALHDLDAAAMALFGAAEAGQWSDARAALDRARAAAAEVGAVEPAFLAAGGQLTQFFEARNNLGGDLVEARTALSVKDRRWLVSTAGRIADRAGELSQPFAEHGNALIPSVEALLFLARRMRRAVVWQDDIGYRSAHDDFKRLWKDVREPLRKQSPDQVRALDQALAQMTHERSTAQAKALYAAVQQLRNGLG
jgi:hypothetical protein